jgi:hypothetical protein
MASMKHFSPAQISCISGTFSHAERLAEKHFRLVPEDWKGHRYDVKTLAELEKHEVSETAFAHLCKYHYSKDDDSTGSDFHFYRVCIQDNRILDAVERGSSFVKLMPLMLYIATHELTHVIRFNRGEGDFDASLEEKVREEERVHSITRQILKPIADRNLNLIIDCFRDRYQIGDIYN